MTKATCGVHSWEGGRPARLNIHPAKSGENQAVPDSAGGTPTLPVTQRIDEVKTPPFTIAASGIHSSFFL